MQVFHKMPANSKSPANNTIKVIDKMTISFFLSFLFDKCSPNIVVVLVIYYFKIRIMAIYVFTPEN